MTAVQRYKIIRYPCAVFTPFVLLLLFSSIIIFDTKSTKVILNSHSMFTRTFGVLLSLNVTFLCILSAIFILDKLEYIRKYSCCVHLDLFNVDL